MSTVASELRHLRGEIVRLNRKLALSRLPIKVTEVREQDDDWQVRGELGEDPRTGTKVLTPWVRVQPAASAELKIKTKPSVGQQMYLLSASGVVGADSLAIWGAFDQDHKPPKGQDDLIIERGGTRVVLNDKAITSTAPEKIEARSGESRHEVTPAKVKSKARRVVADGRTYLGSEHASNPVDKTDANPSSRVFTV